jgi:hypothetical protein
MITDPEELVWLFEPVWDVLKLIPEEREPMRSYLRDIAALHDWEALRHLAGQLDREAIDEMGIEIFLANQVEDEIRKLPGQP